MTDRWCRTCGEGIPDILALVRHDCEAILRAPDLSLREQDTLLYVEARVVDDEGILDMAQMNYEDDQSLKVFSAAGAVKVGGGRRNPDNPREDIRYVEQFTDAAWTLAGECRQLRAVRTIDRDISLGTMPSGGDEQDPRPDTSSRD